MHANPSFYPCGPIIPLSAIPAFRIICSTSEASPCFSNVLISFYFQMRVPYLYILCLIFRSVKSRSKGGVSLGKKCYFNMNRFFLGILETESSFSIALLKLSMSRPSYAFFSWNSIGSIFLSLKMKVTLLSDCR